MVGYITANSIVGADRRRKRRIRSKRVTVAGILVTYDDAEERLLRWRHMRAGQHGMIFPAPEFRRSHPDVPRCIQLPSRCGNAARRLITRQQALALAERGQSVHWRQSSPLRVFLAMLALGTVLLALIVLLTTGLDGARALSVLRQRLSPLPALDQFMVVLTLLGLLSLWFGMCFACAMELFPYWWLNRRRWPRDVTLTADTLEIVDADGAISRHELADLDRWWSATLDFRTADGSRMRVALEPFRAETKLWLRVLACRLPWRARVAYDRYVVRYLGTVALLMSILSELQLRYLKPLTAQPGDGPGVPGGMLALGLAMWGLAEFSRWWIGLRPSLRRRWWKNYCFGRMGANSGADA